MKNFGCALMTLLTLAAPAFADVVVSSPSNGANVGSPATYTATSSTSCPAGVASMGVYVDNALVYVVQQNTLNTAVNLTPGAHHTVVQEWDYCGGSTFAPLDVTSGSNTIPPNALSSGDLTGSNGWRWTHDRGTPGYSTGSSNFPVGNPSTNGNARQFYVTYSQHGGEIYHLTFANDPVASNFVIDTYLFITDPSQVKNIELDMNQVMADGRTVIFGVQCSGYSQTWEYTTVNGGPHWHPSNIPCNPALWTANAWHHVQIASHRDGNGVATYDWVNLDGVSSNFLNATGYSGLYLGWNRGDLLMNFQLDGARGDSGSINAFLDQTTVYRW